MAIQVRRVDHPCECGCGLPAPPSRRFIHGHNARTDAWRLQRYARGRRRERRCANPCCGKVFRRADSTRPKTCSVVCRSVAAADAVRWCPLQERVLKQCTDTGTSVRALSVQIGYGPSGLPQWFKHKGRALHQEQLQKLAEFVGEDYATALRDAGHQTAEDRLTHLGRDRIAALPLPGTPERRERARIAGHGNKGRPKSKEHVKAAAQARKESG